MSHLKAVLSTYLSWRLSSVIWFSVLTEILTNCAGILGQELEVSVSVLSSDVIKKKKKALQTDLPGSQVANTHWYQNTAHFLYCVLQLFVSNIG